MSFDFAVIPAITVAVYVLALLLKSITQVIKPYLPAICGFAGGVLALAVYFTVPQCLPAQDWLCALAIGIVSGLAATGAHQTYRQVTERKEDE